MKKKGGASNNGAKANNTGNSMKLNTSANSTSTSNNSVNTTSASNNSVNSTSASNNSVNSTSALNNSVNSTSASQQKSKKIVIGILVVIGIILLCVGGYYLYNHLTSYKASEEKTKMLIPYIQDAKTERIIQSGSIPAPSQGNEFNMNFWIYISDYNYRKEHDKCILYRGSLVNEDSETNSLINSNPDKTYERCNPGVWLLSYVNTLRVVVGLETKYDDNKDVCEHFQPGSNADLTLTKEQFIESLPEDLLSQFTEEELETLTQNQIQQMF